MKRVRTVHDYMQWRGDLTLEQDPFNEVDSVILGMVSFLDFSGIVPAPGEAGTVAFRHAVDEFDAIPGKDRHFGVIIPDETLDLAREAAHCPRYADARLFAFENQVDESREMQFAAVTFLLSDGTLFAAFRGTDDTIVGWKEDFNMSFMSHVPAQDRAAAYLNTVARQYPGGIRTGGHSKGGNLAIWSVVHADEDVRNRVIRAYSNDGPGFSREMLESDAYRTMRDRCITFVPQSSLVGMLMEHDENYRIIRSAQTGLMQHDPFSWDLERNHYVYLPERSLFGEHSDSAMRLWTESMTAEEKQILVRDLFEVLESTGARTLTELDENRVKNLTTMYKTVAGYDKSRRKRMNQLLGRLLAAQVEAVLPEKGEKEEKS